MSSAAMTLFDVLQGGGWRTQARASCASKS